MHDPVATIRKLLKRAARGSDAEAQLASDEARRLMRLHAVEVDPEIEAVSLRLDVESGYFRERLAAVAAHRYKCASGVTSSGSIMVRGHPHGVHSARVAYDRLKAAAERAMASGPPAPQPVEVCDVTSDWLEIIGEPLGGAFVQEDLFGNSGATLVLRQLLGLRGRNARPAAPPRPVPVTVDEPQRSEAWRRAFLFAFANKAVARYIPPPKAKQSKQRASDAASERAPTPTKVTSYAEEKARVVESADERLWQAAQAAAEQAVRTVALPKRRKPSPTVRKVVRALPPYHERYEEVRPSFAGAYTEALAPSREVTMAPERRGIGLVEID